MYRSKDYLRLKSHTGSCIKGMIYMSRKNNNNNKKPYSNNLGVMFMTTFEMVLKVVTGERDTAHWSRN